MESILPAVVGACFMYPGKSNTATATSWHGRAIGRRWIVPAVAMSKAMPGAGQGLVECSSAGGGQHSREHQAEGIQFHMAPMQCYTNRFFRYLMRGLSSKVVTWTEMEKAADLLASDAACERRLRHSLHCEGSLTVLQLGGSDVAQMARAAALARRYGFGEININCGCPSIETGGAPDYGAALMAKAPLVRQVCDAVSEASGLPVSVKCRVGTFDRIEDMPEGGGQFQQLASFVDDVSSSGTVKSFTVHARAAVMGGLSPSKNRLVPPLQHDLVHRLARERPMLSVILNGGMLSCEDLRIAANEGSGIKGVMAGRWLLQSPLDAVLLDRQDFLTGGAMPAKNMARAIEKYRMYCQVRSSSPHGSAAMQFCPPPDMPILSRMFYLPSLLFQTELASGTCALSDALSPLVLVVEQLRDMSYPAGLHPGEVEDTIRAAWDVTDALTGTKGARGTGTVDDPGLKKAAQALKKKMGTKVYNKVMRNRGEVTWQVNGPDEGYTD